MYKISIVLTDGRTMNAELDESAAPASVENFVSLVKSGFYDGLCFHRVIPAFMIQGGGYMWNDGLTHKDAPATVKGEFASNGFINPLKHVPGTLSMARTPAPDSASSQFFICVEELPYLDGQYAAFGKLTDAESLAVAIEISRTKTGRIDGFSDVPVEPVVIKTITLTE